MNYTPEQLDEIYTSLPKVLQDALSSADIALKVEAIAKKYRLLLPQAAELSDETTRVLMGLSSIANFERNIASLMEISPVLAREISAEINEEVFKPVKSYLVDHTERAVSTPQTPNEEITEDRDELLKEIEQSEPVQNIVLPTPTPNIPEVVPEQEITIPTKPIINTAPVPQTPTGSFIEQKLSGPVTATQETKQVPMPPAQKYKVDPYREPI